MTEPVFTEDWFGDDSCRVLQSLVASVAHLKGDIVEVGAWEGRSTIALAQATGEDVITIDTWKGSPGEISEGLAAERDVFGRFIANLAAANVNNVTAHHTDWRDYFTTHTSPVKFLFIDAEHTYTEVRDNIETVLPMLVPGGIICGDDVHHPPIVRAVIDVLGDAATAATLWYWQS